MNQLKNSALLFIALTFTFCNVGFAQLEKEQKVKSTITMFFDGMRKGDVILLKSTLGDSCQLSTILETENGSKIEKGSIKKFVESLGKKDPTVIYDERILSYDIKIDGPMAIAWTPYKFYVNDQFSHCGVNVFTLAQREGENWAIISISDTRRKEPCNL